MDCDKILQTDGGSIITGLRCFSLPLILDCGQAFRWSENADGSWSGVAMSRELRLKQHRDMRAPERGRKSQNSVLGISGDKNIKTGRVGDALLVYYFSE